MGSIPFIHLKKGLTGLLEKLGVEASSVSSVVMAGGLSGMPKAVSVVKSIFPTAEQSKTRGVDLNEAQATGAALQASHLVSTQLVDKAPTASSSPKSKTMQSSVELVSGETKKTLFEEGTVLPAHYELKGSLAQADGAFKLLVDAKEMEAVSKADMVGDAEESWR